MFPSALVLGAAAALVAAVSYCTVNRYFALKVYRTSYGAVFATLWANMCALWTIAYLLPWDLHNSSSDSLVYFEIAWQLLYWMQFVMCWFVVPIMISYVSLKYAFGGRNSPKMQGRLLRAIFQNVKFYGLCLTGVVFGILYLMVSTGHTLVSDFKPLLIALTHLYSLSYALVLLATGLVIVPRDLYNSARTPTLESANKLYVELSNLSDDFNEVKLTFSDSANKILKTAPVSTADVVFNETLTECQMEIEEKLNYLRNYKNVLTPGVDILSHGITAGMSSGTTRPSSIMELDKLNEVYQKFLSNYYNFIYIQNSAGQVIANISKSQLRTTSLNRVNKVGLSLIAFIAGTLSSLVLLLEILPLKWFHAWLFIEKRYYNLILHFTILSYNILISLYAMSKFKFFHFHLINDGYSSPTNALYYSLYSSRLLFPLCFNFMSMVPLFYHGKKISESGFGKTLLHDLTLIPLVNWLNKYLPIFFMSVIPLSYKFDFKRKVLMKILGPEYYYQLFGMMLFQPDQDSLDENVLRSHSNNLNESATYSDSHHNISSYYSTGDVGLPRTLPMLIDNSTSSNRISQDYDYALQEGKYLFERACASENYNLDNTDSTGTLNAQRSVEREGRHGEHVAIFTDQILDGAQHV